MNLFHIFSRISFMKTEKMLMLKLSFFTGKQPPTTNDSVH